MTLDMALKKPWYDAISRGIKKIEYRDMSDYWIEKLLVKGRYGNKTNDDIKNGLIKGELEPYFANWTEARFHNPQGVPMTFEIKQIKVYDNHPTFAIYLGKRLK